MTRAQQIVNTFSVDEIISRSKPVNFKDIAVGDTIIHLVKDFDNQNFNGKDLFWIGTVTENVSGVEWNGVERFYSERVITPGGKWSTPECANRYPYGILVVADWHATEDEHEIRIIK